MKAGGKRLKLGRRQDDVGQVQPSPPNLSRKTNEGGAGRTRMASRSIPRRQHQRWTVGLVLSKRDRSAESLRYKSQGPESGDH